MPDTTRNENQDSLRDARQHIADSIKIARQYAEDSTKLARKYAMDSSRQVRERISDSVKLVRQEKTDSAQRVRKRIADSTASVRRYHDSKHYKDSVTRARAAKSEAIKDVREAHADSIKTVRKHMSDSLLAVRKARTDSIKTIQKRRTDSLAQIKKYKSSRRYTDSVELVRRDRMDSITNAREHFKDSLTTARKHVIDSTKTARKRVADSVKTVRDKFLDSIKLVRKERADSLAKVKKQKEELAKAKEKKKNDALKLKLELKMAQKHEKWSNQSMLKKPWTPVRRVTQNSFTHYNYYFNAKRKMDDALLNMQRQRKENYDSLIGLYPYDPNRDSSQMLADMDSIVHKASVAIQIHDPRVKWANDMYLLLGQAYYYKGSYSNAATAFRYIIASDEKAKKAEAAKNGYKDKGGASIVEEENHSKLDFLKHKSVHNESVLWLARTFTESNQVENAESILSLLVSDPKFPDDMQGRLAQEKAFTYLSENNLPEAGKQLAVVEDDQSIPKWLRMRAAFLHGQILQNMGEYKDASNSFAKVLTYFPKLEMDFYSRKYVAFNKLLAGEDVEEAMRPLKKVLNDGKYVSYYDQVYYVLGQLAVKAAKPDLAINYFTKSATYLKASKKQKAISFAALGDVYFSEASYAQAKRAYDSAGKYASAAPKDALVKNAEQKNKGLTEITGPITIIHDNDSLLALSALSKKEQLSAVRNYLKYLKKLQQDSIDNAAATGAASSESEGSTGDESGWYFANPSLVQQGSDEFKKKWGNRPLADNWRRSSSNSFADNSGSGQDAETDGAGADNSGLPTEASLLAKIPNTSQQKDAAYKNEQRAYIFLARAYMKQLEDYDRANGALDTLDHRYPDHHEKEEELYLRYQIAVKQNKLKEAQGYADELLSRFPTSKYVDELKPKHNKNENEHLIAGKTEAQYCDATYDLVMQHQYTEALMNINTAKKQFENPVYKKRIDVLEASAYAGQGDYKLGDSLIRKFIADNPRDSLTSWASEVKKYIGEVKNGGRPSWYNDTLSDAEKAMLAKKNARKNNNGDGSSAMAAPPKPVIPPVYTFHADSEHYCIIVLPGLDSRTAGLKKNIKDFDSANYGYANLDMLMDFYDISQDILIIRKFGNQGQAKGFMEALKGSDVFQGYGPEELHIFIISTANYKRMYYEKNAQPYYNFYNMYY